MDASLAPFRAEFDLPPGTTYLVGHSLGPPPRRALERLRAATEREWAHGLVRSWNDADWIGAPERVGAKIAGLIGAKPQEVLVSDCTTVALWKLAAAALLARPGRRVVLSEPGNFPTDLYALEGLVRALGGGRSLELASLPPLIPANAGTQIVEQSDRNAKLAPVADEEGQGRGCEPYDLGPGIRRDEREIEGLEGQLGPDTALLVLTHVHYKTAEVRDMARLTEAAHATGALVLWDLSHTTGVVEADLNGCGVDLAVGCGYKYLNGGPGAPAFLFVAERLQAALDQPLSGWMGHAAPFAFEDAYRPHDSIAKFATGTPPILSLAALEGAVELALEAGAPALAAHARRLTSAFIAAVDAGPAGRELTLISPRDDARRGGHVAYTHPHGYGLMQALITRGVIGDFRAPDVLRFGFSPLYLGVEDVARAVAVLHELVEARAWADPAHAVRARVT